MINRFALLRNIGQFDSVAVPNTIQNQRLTGIYADNGRGKTTLTAIMRSFKTGNPLPINERSRLGAQHQPHIVLESASLQHPAVFSNGAWSGTRPNMAIFDDNFVDENVYSGLSVEPGHRQNLHELIVGAQGVHLHQELQAYVGRINDHNTELRRRADAISIEILGGLSLDDFCGLPVQPDIEATIEAAERDLAAAKQQDPVRTGALLQTLTLPAVNLPAVEEILQRHLAELNAEAAAMVQAHLEGLGKNGEAWVAEGLNLLREERREEPNGPCPFCAQDLTASAVIQHYTAFFSNTYTDLKNTVATLATQLSRAHGPQVVADFERGVRVNGERGRFWSQFTHIPNIALDTAAIVRDWHMMLEAVQELLDAKKASPLERIALTPKASAAVERYQQHQQTLQELNVEIEEANERIDAVKMRTAGANPVALATAVSRLKAIRARHTPEVAALCTEYLQEKAAKAATEALRDQARTALETYRTRVFPTYEVGINEYLRRFNAGFTLDRVAPANTRAGSACTYNLVINNNRVSVAGGNPAPGTPAFRNTLSAGDRNTLALAFFFTSLDQCPFLANKVVVIDDPVSSLDEHRCLTTVHQIRQLSQRVTQVIVLSHSKPFLCSLLESLPRGHGAALQVVRAATGSALQEWDVTRDSVSAHDHRHKLLRDFAMANTGNSRQVAEAIRPVLEAFLRVACPEHFPPGTLAGRFRDFCEQRLAAGQPVLDAAKTQELRELIEYGNRFHHDTNPAWQAEAVNDGELLGYVTRTLAFAAC